MELLIFIVGIGVLAISIGISAHLQKRIDKLESIMNAELAMARDSLYLAKKQLSEHEHEDKSLTELEDKLNDIVKDNHQMKLNVHLSKKKIEKLQSGSLDVIDEDKTYSRREVEDYLNINQYQRTKLVKDGLLTEHRKAPKWPDLSEYYYDGKDIETYANQKERKEAVK